MSPKLSGFSFSHASVASNASMTSLPLTSCGANPRASGDGADLGAGEREESSSVREAPAAPEGLGRGARNAGQVRSYGSGASKRDAAASGSPRDGHGAPEDGSPKKKRHRPSRDRARERIEKRMPLTRAGVDALDWNEACEYAKSMGVSQGSKRVRNSQL